MTDTTATAPARRAHASQDQQLANRIHQYRTALAAVQAHAETGGLLAPRGYDAAALAAGAALCDAAQAAYNARQEAMAVEKSAAWAVRGADRAARAGFDDFRKIARAVFKTNPSARASVGADGRVPDDREKFLAAASAGYASALGHSTYLAALAKRGVAQATLQAEQAKLEALTGASAAHDAARAAARRATADRAAAAKAMDAWWSEFRAVAGVALKDRPDLLGPLSG